MRFSFLSPAKIGIDVMMGKGKGKRSVPFLKVVGPNIFLGQNNQDLIGQMFFNPSLK